MGFDSIRADSAVSEFERLFADHERRLGQFLVQIVGSRPLAEDLLQETFISAFRQDLSSVGNVSAWLYSVARNRALHALRTRRRAHAAFVRLGNRAQEPFAADPAESVAARDLIERSVGPEDRVILILRHVHGFDGRELAQILDVSPEAARKRLSRARRRLLDALQERPDRMAAQSPPERWAHEPAESREESQRSGQTEVRRVQEFLAPLAEIAPVALPHSAVARARRRHRPALDRLLGLFTRSCV